MKPEDLLALYGSQAKAAKELGHSPQLVSYWFRKRRIPIGRQFEIEVKTGGALKADRRLTK